MDINTRIVKYLKRNSFLIASGVLCCVYHNGDFYDRAAAAASGLIAAGCDFLLTVKKKEKYDGDV